MGELPGGTEMEMDEGAELQRRYFEEALRVDPSESLSRYHAGAVLAEVADLGADGHFPEKVSVELLANSLSRIVSNSNFDMHDDSGEMRDPVVLLAEALEDVVARR